MNENERNKQDRDSETGRKDDEFNKQGQSATGQTAEQGQSQPSHQQSVDGGSVTAAGGGSSGPGAGTTGLDRDQQGQQGSQGGFVGSQGEESGEYLQQDKRDQPNQGGFAEDGQGAPKGSTPGNVEGNRERDQNRDSDIEGSSNS